jgi:hypothetical protein
MIARDSTVAEQEPIAHDTIQVGVSDPAQLPSLTAWLTTSGQVQVKRVPGRPGPGELGAMDVLTIVASSSALIAAFRVLPEFIRSRRSGFHIEVTVKGKSFKVDATNVVEVLPILERLLDD